jgi:hypothetical protein
MNPRRHILPDMNNGIRAWVLLCNGKGYWVRIQIELGTIHMKDVGRTPAMVLLKYLLSISAGAFELDERAVELDRTLVFDAIVRLIKALLENDMLE